MQTFIVYTDQAHSGQIIKEIGGLRVYDYEQAAQMLMSHKTTVLLFVGLGQFGKEKVFKKPYLCKILNTPTEN